MPKNMTPRPAATAAMARALKMIARNLPSLEALPQLSINDYVGPVRAHVADTSFNQVGNALVSGFALNSVTSELVFLDFTGSASEVKAIMGGLSEAKTPRFVLKGRNTGTFIQAPERPKKDRDEGVKVKIWTVQHVPLKAIKKQNVTYTHTACSTLTPSFESPYLYIMDTHTVATRQRFMRIAASVSELPLRKEWGHRLWDLARHAELLSECVGEPNRFWQISHDRIAWRNLVQNAVFEEVLSF